MSDDQGPDPTLRVDPQIRMIIDQVGDPYLTARLVLPDGAALSADQMEHLGLSFIAAAADARVRAGVVRKRLFAGVPPVDAVRAVSELLD